MIVWVKHNGSHVRPDGVGPNDHVAVRDVAGEHEGRADDFIWTWVSEYIVMFSAGCPQIVPVSGIGDVTSNTAGSGARYNTGKPRLDLIPGQILAAYTTDVPVAPAAGSARAAMNALGLFQTGADRSPGPLLEAIRWLDEDGQAMADAARVFEYGLKKYAAWNWAKGMPWSVPVGCALRHLVALARGEADDAESGLPHRGHAVCNLIMLLWYLDHWAPGNDLRAPAVAACSDDFARTK